MIRSIPFLPLGSRPTRAKEFLTWAAGQCQDYLKNFKANSCLPETGRNPKIDLSNDRHVPESGKIRRTSPTEHMARRLRKPIAAVIGKGEENSPLDATQETLAKHLRTETKSMKCVERTSLRGIGRMALRGRIAL